MVHRYQTCQLRNHVVQYHSRRTTEGLEQVAKQEIKEFVGRFKGALELEGRNMQRQICTCVCVLCTYICIYA